MRLNYNLRTHIEKMASHITDRRPSVLLPNSAHFSLRLGISAFIPPLAPRKAPSRRTRGILNTTSRSAAAPRLTFPLSPR